MFTPLRSLILLLLLLGGCSTPSVQPTPPPNRDPWEGVNRSIYRFNDRLDRAVIQPVARGYRTVTPQFIDTGVTNFFRNLDDLSVIVYEVLQFKLGAAAADLLRLTANTTIGLAGLVDVATPMGLEKHNEDLGQTLAVWGVGSGPYLVLPFLGPSTLRDSSSVIVELATDLEPTHQLPDPERYGLLTLKLVDKRADLLPITDQMEQNGGDPYLFLREAYLQRRQFLIYDGQMPTQSEPDIDQLLDDRSSAPPQP